MLNNFIITLHRFYKFTKENKIRKMDANDNELLRHFKQDHNTLIKNQLKIANTLNNTSTPLLHVLELPNDPYDDHYNCIFQKDPTTLYDSHRFGQLLGGLPRSPWVPHINEVGSFHPNITDMIWEEDYAGRWIVQYHNLTIFNLHVHSKQFQVRPS